MIVYIVQTKMYDNQSISGVYATPEAAIVAHPIPERLCNVVPNVDYSVRPGGWCQLNETEWSNGLDWDDYACITAYEVQS